MKPTGRRHWSGRVKQVDHSRVGKTWGDKGTRGIAVRRSGMVVRMSDIEVYFTFPCCHFEAGTISFTRRCLSLLCPAM